VYANKMAVYISEPSRKGNIVVSRSLYQIVVMSKGQTEVTVPNEVASRRKLGWHVAGVWR
jgi:hypothetical protein